LDYCGPITIIHQECIGTKCYGVTITCIATNLSTSRHRQEHDIINVSMPFLCQTRIAQNLASDKASAFILAEDITECLQTVQNNP
ncbi:hypothetical protein Angca_002029, partial [Angiostrongylus cantonensis]